MENIIVYKDINRLVTPVGDFIVESEDGEQVNFSVMMNLMDSPYEVTEASGNVIGIIQSATNYTIKIDNDKLMIGAKYRISFSAGQWEYNDSDENTDCYSTIIDDWAVGIGAYDPCGEIKDLQAWNYSKEKGYLDQGFCQYPSTYDETEFRGYTVEVLDEKNGYEFVLFDKCASGVFFNVAWIRVSEYSTDAYEGALGLWLC